MAETNGAKIIPGPGVRTPNAVRDEAILQDLARGVKAAELAEKHGVSIQRIYNLKSENRDRVAQLQVAEIEVMPILKHQTFADLWIMKPAARMAGFSEIGQVALRKFLELNAASYVYDPESGQPVATRLNRHDVAAMKVFADMYSKAVRDAVELSGEMPARLGERFVLRTIKKHQDPPPPKSEEELAAEEAEQEREARYQAEREARVAARMRQQYPFLFPLSEAENARRNELFDAQYDAEAASLRANGMALTEEEKAERLAYLEGLGDDLLDGRDLARLEYLQGRFDADDDEYNALQGEVDIDSALEPAPEPSVTAPVRDEKADGFVASVAAAMRGDLALEFDA